MYPYCTEPDGEGKKKEELKGSESRFSQQYYLKGNKKKRKSKPFPLLSLHTMTSDDGSHTHTHTHKQIY